MPLRADYAIVRDEWVMKKWLNKNSKWLGALGAIAAIIATLIVLVPEDNKSSQAQKLVIDGTNHNATQIQEKSGGNQSAFIDGEGHTTQQMQ